MIAKAVKGVGFRGALDYDIKQEKGYLLDTNMSSDTPRALAQEFGTIRQLRPNLGKAVLHVSLSAAVGEHLTDQQWRTIGQRYLAGMDLDHNQYVMTRHTDTEHEHIHLVVNRIQFNGSVTSDSHDYRRQEAIMRSIERDYGLQQVAPSIEVQRTAPTKGEIEHSLRTGVPSTRQRLQQLCDGAAQNCTSFTVYQERLDAAGVALVPVVQLDGAKLSGLSYRLEGVTMKGSDLGKGYSPVGLAKRGVRYEQNRDVEAVRAAQERHAAHELGAADRGAAARQIPERGSAGRDAGAAGARDGELDRRDAANLGRDRAQEPGEGRRIPRQDPAHDAGMAGRGASREPSRDRVGPGREPDGVAPLRPGVDDRVDYSGARERIVALAGTADHRKPARSGASGEALEVRPDPSLEAIQAQMNALGVARVEVSLHNRKTGQTTQRQWNCAELEQCTPWLKRMNAQGNDVYLRPAGAHCLVLVDGLTPAALDQMKKEGFAPAITVETSPGQHQAWVKLWNLPVAPEVRLMAAQMMAKHYGGNTNNPAYGRLAGFANQRPEHTRDGKQPYVLAHDGTGTVAPAGPGLAQGIVNAIEKDKLAAQKEQQIERQVERQRVRDRDRDRGQSR